VRRGKVHVRSNGELHEITLEIVPIKTASEALCLLVLFHEAEGTGTVSVFSETGASEVSAGSRDGGDAAPQEIEQLRRELASTREYLQALIEQQDGANEELRSANEEILSSNEELQSTNEELETAKEELQSTNEELITVNEQLQDRNLKLSQSTNDLNNLLTSTNIPVVMVGPDLRVRRFTAAARNSMNLLSADIGRPFTDLKASVEVPDVEKLIDEVIDTVQIRQREVRDREGRWHLLRIHPYRTSENKIDGAVILLLDIDEIKRAEESLRDRERQLRLALEAGSAGTWHHDLITGEFSWDDVTAAIFGLPAATARSDAAFLSSLEPTDRERLLAARARAIVEHGKFTEEVRLQRPDGEAAWLLVKGQPTYSETGQPLSIAGVCVDVTERRRLAEAERAHLSELQEGARRKDEFLATLAHELRNPLAPMRNAAQILRNPAISPAQAEWCRSVIDRQVSQMTRLLDDLLDVSRITRDLLQFRKETVALSKIIEGALEESRPLIEAERHELTVNVPDEPVILEADPTRLVQVFSNLLNNAAKYTEPGGAIDLRVKPEGESVTVSIKDTGKGIEPEFLPRIFDMFAQGNSGHGFSQSGLGLGLTLAKRLLEMHGGRIEARSEGRDKGSEFIVRLPLLASGSPGEPPIGEEAPGAPAPVMRRILVVDDRQAQAQSLKLLLESMGHQVRIAYDGLSAVEMALDFLPEVALVDIGLPGMSGYDVARRLRAQPQLEDMLLIAQTGWGRDQDRQRSREAGFDHHMAKPIDTEALLRLISRGRFDS
jgi:two-component system CheB/CheR fusion protein